MAKSIVKFLYVNSAKRKEDFARIAREMLSPSNKKGTLS